MINLGVLQKFIDANKVDLGSTVTEDLLLASGLVTRKRDGVRILAKGKLSSKINLIVTGASKAAIKAVEKAGGTLSFNTG